MVYEKGQKVFYGSGINTATVLDGPFHTLECPVEDCYEVRMHNGWIGTMRAVDLYLDKPDRPDLKGFDE